MTFPYAGKCNAECLGVDVCGLCHPERNIIWLYYFISPYAWVSVYTTDNGYGRGVSCTDDYLYRTERK